MSSKLPSPVGIWAGLDLAGAQLNKSWAYGLVGGRGPPLNPTLDLDPPPNTRVHQVQSTAQTASGFI